MNDWTAPHLRRSFEYVLLPAAHVIQCLSWIDKSAAPDSYLSKEPATDALKDVLALGYRWIRTEGDHAVFEREILRSPHLALEERKK